MMIAIQRYGGGVACVCVAVCVRVCDGGGDVAVMLYDHMGRITMWRGVWLWGCMGEGVACFISRKNQADTKSPFFFTVEVSR